MFSGPNAFFVSGCTLLVPKRLVTLILGCIICSLLPSGMGARGVRSEHVENMEMFSLFSNLGALWSSENLIRYSLHDCLREVKNNLFFVQTLLFTAFLVTVLKILTYALESTWSLGSSRWEDVKWKKHPWSKGWMFHCAEFRVGLFQVHHSITHNSTAVWQIDIQTIKVKTYNSE